LIELDKHKYKKSLSTVEKSILDFPLGILERILQQINRQKLSNFSEEQILISLKKNYFTYSFVMKKYFNLVILVLLSLNFCKQAFSCSAHYIQNEYEICLNEGFTESTPELENCTLNLLRMSETQFIKLYDPCTGSKKKVVLIKLLTTHQKKDWENIKLKYLKQTNYLKWLIYKAEILLDF